MFRKIFFFVLLILLAFSSCSKKGANEIKLDTSDPLALVPDVRWAVVKIPYAAFRKGTSWDAQAVAYCKRGEFFPILATSELTIEGETEVWYRFEDGWLHESIVSVYSNKLRAAKASEQLK